MTDYRYHIALIVPADQKDRANEAAAALTGRSADLQTFRTGHGFLDDDGTEYLLAGPTPMTDDHVEALPLLASQFDLDAEWETIAIWDGGRQPVTTVEEWAGSLGLHRLPINLNTASQTTLTALPKIGPSTAESIIDERPFATVDDLTRVSGIGESTLDDIRPYVTAGEI